MSGTPPKACEGVFVEGSLCLNFHNRQLTEVLQHHLGRIQEMMYSSVNRLSILQLSISTKTLRSNYVGIFVLIKVHILNFHHIMNSVGAKDEYT